MEPTVTFTEVETTTPLAEDGLEVVISFDDTGSMSSVRKQVRQRAVELVKKLFSLNKNIRIGIIIHNDYCDHDTIQHLPLTENETKITDFINKGSSCGGGDADECYELAINYFHSQFDWKTNKRVAILIGDCNPHEKGYTHGKTRVELNWRDELKTCVANNIKVYPVQALERGSSNTFYNTISQTCSTPKLNLSQFAHITQFITAILYQEEGKLEEYENSQAEFKTNVSLRNMFNKLKGLGEVAAYTSKSDGKSDGIVSLASRFQVLEVGPSKRVIKEFVESNGTLFKKGRGFYQFVLTEDIQEKKEVLFVDKRTGEVQSDTRWCREQLGVPYGIRGRVNPREVACTKQYNVFIQSTSYNRKLDPNTQFLYELDYK